MIGTSAIAESVGESQAAGTFEQAGLLDGVACEPVGNEVPRLGQKERRTPESQLEEAGCPGEVVR